MKKSKIKPSGGRKDRPSDTGHKPGVARLPQSIGDGLTCSEAQIEDLLSKGEST